MATTIKPLEDRVLVQPLEAEQTTASGLVIPAVSYTHLTLPTIYSV